MNGEKGQALPLAILALAIGALLIAPFLGHAGTSLIGSRTYADAISFRNSCDAGVEHAIWSLTRGTLAEQLPNPGDRITYQLGEMLNGVNTTVTVTANATGEAAGSITKTVIDLFDFENSYCYTPIIIHVSGNIYAIAYEGPASDGFIRTIEIAPDGNITNTAIDTLEFDTSECHEPDIAHVSGNYYAIAYRGPGNDGFLKTVTIAVNGDIGNSAIDTLEFDTSNGYEPDIILVSGNYYAIAYRGSGNDGFLKTATIAANGDIGNSVIDTLEFDPGNCHEPDIYRISSTVYAIAYQGVSGDGFLKTVTIAANGDIGNSVIDTLEFDTTNCVSPDIINISGITFAIVYAGSNSDGFVTTMTVSAAGAISNSVIDTFEFDPSNAQAPKIIYITGDAYAIAYYGPGNDGFLKTLPIESSGNIPGTITDTFEYDTSNGYYPDIIKITDNIYAIAYCIPSARGSLVTIGIDTGSTAATYRIVSAAGNMTVNALVNTDNTTASIVSWLIE